MISCGAAPAGLLRLFALLLLTWGGSERVKARRSLIINNLLGAVPIPKYYYNRFLRGWSLWYSLATFQNCRYNAIIARFHKDKMYLLSWLQLPFAVPLSLSCVRSGARLGCVVYTYVGAVCRGSACVLVRVPWALLIGGRCPASAGVLFRSCPLWCFSRLRGVPFLGFWRAGVYSYVGRAVGRFWRVLKRLLYCIYNAVNVL